MKGPASKGDPGMIWYDPFCEYSVTRCLSTNKVKGRARGGRGRGMQPIPGCRTLVWKKEWRQTVGSQTSLTTGTRRVAKGNEQREKEKTMTRGG